MLLACLSTGLSDFFRRGQGRFRNAKVASEAAQQAAQGNTVPCLVATYRDFRDVLCSHARRGGEGNMRMCPGCNATVLEEKQAVVRMLGKLFSHGGQAAEAQTLEQRGALLLRYEAFYDCPRLLMDTFAKWLGVGDLLKSGMPNNADHRPKDIWRAKHRGASPVVAPAASAAAVVASSRRRRILGLLSTNPPVGGFIDDDYGSSLDYREHGIRGELDNPASLLPPPPLSTKQRHRVLLQHKPASPELSLNEGPKHLGDAALASEADADATTAGAEAAQATAEATAVAAPEEYWAWRTRVARGTSRQSNGASCVAWDRFFNGILILTHAIPAHTQANLLHFICAQCASHSGRDEVGGGV